MPLMSRRILVARLDSMGDVLLSGPAVRAVAAKVGEVVMLCSGRGAAAAAMLPGVSDVITWESPWISARPVPVRAPHLDELIRRVRRRSITEAMILTSYHQSPLPLALLLRLAGVLRITGVSTDYPGSLLDVRLRPGVDLAEDLPEPQRSLAVAVAAGFRLPHADAGNLAIRGSADVSGLVGDEPYVVVHPGTDAPARPWPAERHAALVELLARDGLRVVVTGGPQGTALAAAVAGSRGLDLGGLDLPKLAGVFAGAELTVVGNTGPAHLAAAVGSPIVSLFSPVVSSAPVAPYRVPTIVLGDQQSPCRGSRIEDCEVPGHRCLTSVSAAQVVAAVHELREATAGARGLGAS
jgi:ADP-heptose:LPS heptosyltransferase